MKIQGIGVSPGLAQAKAWKMKQTDLKITESQIENISAEIIKVDKVIEKVVEQIKEVKKAAAKNNLSEKELTVFDAHIQIATDPALVSEIKKCITETQVNALFATKKITDNFIQTFENMPDTYMQERAMDIKDVAQKILHILAGVPLVNLASINFPVVVVAHDLTPSETALLDKKYVKGFLTNIGGETSHAAIMARSLEIPAIVGLKNITDQVKTGDPVWMDGEIGTTWIQPTAQELIHFNQNKEQFEKDEKDKLTFLHKKSLTKDQIHIELAANIGSPADLALVKQNGAEGVGLFRSEFLYMYANSWPSEETQLQAYTEVLEKMSDQRVVIRTLDIGGDKKLGYYNFPEEMNPFLGYRAIRLCLEKQTIFKTQLRALLRASVSGKLAIMFPMIASLEELWKAQAILADCQKELQAEKIPFASDIEVGMMMETPAAAILADQFAKYVDFFSIGTNDLIQYTMAADRMSEKVAYLYQPLNPSILRMVNLVVQGAKKHGKWVGMCGQMASDKKVVPLLVGMGFEELSMSASSILTVKKQIAKIDSQDAQKLVQKVLDVETEAQVWELVKKFNLSL